ncbi:tetratricopeptide repeat protein [Candidatus Obscuribacterales bacterium]|nr:tetratricopeptide repeat protein [Candidatus Obscuribacterales bacterium]
MRVPRLLIVAISLCLAIDQTCSGAVAFSWDESASSSRQIFVTQNDDTEIDSPLVLSLSDDGSVCGALRLNYYFDAFWNKAYRVLRIGDVYTKGLSIVDLQKLLRGKHGSLKAIDVVSAETGETLTVGIPVREVSPTSLELTPSLGTASGFDRPNFYTSTKLLAQQAKDFGVIPLAIATYRNILNSRPGVLPQPPDSEIVTALPDALRLFDESGSFDDSQFAIDLATRITAKQLGEFTPSGLTALTETAVYLSQSGRNDRASAIWKNLTATTNSAKLRERLHVLSGYGLFLMANPSFGSPRTQFETMESLIQGDLRRDCLPSLQALLNYYERSRDLEKSEKLVETILELQDLEPLKGAAHYAQYQEKVRVLLQLARIRTDAAQYTKAEQALNQALDFYRRNLDKHELITLERLNSFSCSAIEIELAHVLSLQNQSTDALKTLESAAQRIERALGEDSCVLKDVFLAKSETCRRAGDESSAGAYLKRAHQLAAREFKAAPSQNNCWRDYLEVHQLIRQDKFSEAEQATEMLVRGIETRGYTDALELSRVICLARKFRSASHISYAKDLLSKLRYLNSVGATPMRSWILAELYCTMHADRPTATSSEFDETWTSLRENENKVFLDRNPSALLNDPTPEQVQLRSYQQLSGLAFLLRALGQPADAELMFRSLQRRAGVGPTRSVPQGLLLSLIEQGKYEEFDKYAHSMEASGIAGLVPVAVLLLHRGQLERARRTVRSIEAFQDQGINVSLAQLAVLKVGLGEFKNAVELFDRTGSDASSHPLAFATALKEEGFCERAIVKFLEAAERERTYTGSGGIGPLQEALTLLERQEKVEDSTISQMVEFLFVTPVKDESTAMSEQIVRVATKLQSKASAPQVLEGLKRILERENCQDLAVQPASSEITEEQENSKTVSRQSQLYNKALHARSLLQHGQDDLSIKLALNVLNQLYREPWLLEASNTPPVRLWSLGRDRPQCNGTLEVLVQTANILVSRRRVTHLPRYLTLLEHCVMRSGGSKNPLLASLYECTAAIADTDGDKAKRLAEIRKAFDIATWAWGAGSPRNRNLRASYITALRDCGENHLAMQFENLPVADLKYPDWHALYGNLSFVTCHSPAPEVFADSAEDALSKWLSQNVEVNGHLDGQVDRTLISLADFYAARKRYSDAEKILTKRLDIFQAVEGRANYHESETYEQIAELRYLSGDLQGAINSLTKAEKVNGTPQYANIALNCAALYLEMGNDRKAANITYQVAKAFQKYDAGGGPLAQCFAQCCFLLGKTGQNAELEKMNALYDGAVQATGRQQYGHEYAGTRSHPFYSRHNGQWIRLTVENSTFDKSKQEEFDLATDYGTVRVRSLQALEAKRKKPAG